MPLNGSSFTTDFLIDVSESLLLKPELAVLYDLVAYFPEENMDGEFSQVFRADSVELMSWPKDHYPYPFTARGTRAKKTTGLSHF